MQPLGLRQEFRTLSSIVNREAVQLKHDTFIPGVTTRLSRVANMQASIPFQPVTKYFLSHSGKTGGNPQGVDLSKAPFFWMIENWTWTDANYDIRVRAAADAITADINRVLASKSYDAKYLYMNDAGGGQPVFQSYPADNLRRLEEIAPNTIL